MALTTFLHDPDAGPLDYLIDWSDWLETSDALDTATWTITGDDEVLERTDDYVNATATSIWVQGGTAGVVYNASVHVVTTGGREDERSIDIRVLER